MVHIYPQWRRETIYSEFVVETWPVDFCMAWSAAGKVSSHPTATDQTNYSLPSCRLRAKSGGKTLLSSFVPRVEKAVVSVMVRINQLKRKSQPWVKDATIGATSVPPDHLLLDRSPNIEPLISRWKLGKFKNCWNKSFRTSKILTLLYQQFLNLLISRQDMSGPRLRTLSNNMWSGGI
jgi:hypothetical protein